MIRISGYLTEQKLQTILSSVPSLENLQFQWRHLPSKCRFRWDAYFERADVRYLVEFDGAQHYTDFQEIKRDERKVLKANTYAFPEVKVVRLPYWVQLNTQTFEHYFEFSHEIETDFAHGFIDSGAALPAAFHYLGYLRYVAELRTLPQDVRTAVQASLQNKVNELGEDMVIPKHYAHLE